MRNKVKLLFQTGFFHIFGGNVMNKIIAFLSSAVLVRILSKEEYGIFTYAWNIYSILILFSGLGIASAMLQIISERGGEQGYTNTILNYSVRWGIICNLILGCIIIFIAKFYPLTLENSRQLLYLLFLLPAIQIIYDLSVAYLRAMKLNRQFIKLSLINAFLVFVISVWSAVFIKEKGLIIGYYFAYAGTCLYGIIFMKIPFFRKADKINCKDKSSIMKISLISMCNNGLSQLLYLLDVFVIGIVAANESILASYKVSTMIPSALSFIPGALVTYLYPYFAEKRLDKNWCLVNYKRILKYFGVFNLCISLGLILSADWLVPLVFGIHYYDSVYVFRILALNYFFSATFRVVSGNLLVTQRKLKFNLFVAVISGTVNVIADIILITGYGSVGAAFATLFVTLISGLLSTTYLLYSLNQ